MTNYKGNISTIIKWISMTIAGATIGTLTAHGLNLTIDTSTLTEVISAIIFLGVGYVDAKYPNTFSFLDNENEIQDIDPASEYEEPQAGDETDDC